jgi:hypothetical protein
MAVDCYRARNLQKKAGGEIHPDETTVLLEAGEQDFRTAPGH